MKASVSNLIHIILMLAFWGLPSSSCSAECGEQNGADAKPHHSLSLLLPQLATVQYAGNIGVISFGPGWEYGHHRQWQTNLLLGYLPHEVMFNDYFCLTIRQSLSPWQCRIGQFYALSPAVFGLSANTLFSGEFWYNDPGDSHYNFSTKLRFHLSYGSRFDFLLPQCASQKGKNRRFSLYYELSTYDLALMSIVRSQSIGITDILCLGLGFQYIFF